MTGTENLDALAEKDFARNWKEVMKELQPIFKQIGRVPGLATYTGLKVDRVTGLSYLRCVEVGT
jgi:hypothetical protein